MKPLASVSKYLRKLVRQSKAGEGEYVLVEGERLISTAARLSPSPPSHLLSTCPHLLNRLRDLCRAKHRGVVGDCVLVSDRLLGDLADAATPQAGLALFPRPEPAKLAELRQRRLDFGSAGDGLRLDYSVLCWRVSDPANVGGIARLGWCLGARRLLLSPGSANPWLPKSIRSGAGAHFDLPIVSDAVELSDADQLLTAFNRIIVASSRDSAGSARVLKLRSDRQLADQLRQDGRSPMCLLLGSEAAGLPDELMQSLLEVGPQRVTVLHVPMADIEQTASLNVAATAGIVLHRLYSLATASAGGVLGADEEFRGQGLATAGEFC